MLSDFLAVFGGHSMVKNGRSKGDRDNGTPFLSESDATVSESLVVPSQSMKIFSVVTQK